MSAPLPLTMPPPVQRALHWLRAQGQRPWLVGGATRDLLLDRPVADFDFALAGDGFTLSRELARAIGGAWVPLDEERGLGRVVVTHSGRHLWIDLARFRDEEAGADGDEAALHADLRLRDFTVNAIALDPLKGVIVDPAGGRADLAARRLHPPDPRAFEMDPLRVLRGVRLEATLGFRLSHESRALARRAVPELAHIAGERLREEWLALLSPAGAAQRVATLHGMGVLEIILPELAATEGVTQSAPHSHDVYGHSLLALTALEALLPWEGDARWTDSLAPWQERVAAHLRQPLAHEVDRWQLLKHVTLLHDVGKATTRTVGDDGRIHFYGHEKDGAELWRTMAHRLKFSRVASDYGERIIAHHLRPLHLSQRVPPRPRSLYRFFRDVGTLAPEIVLHSLADQRGKAFATDREEVVAVGRAVLEAFFDQRARYLDVRPLLDGNQIMAQFGWRGPRVGLALEFLREQQAMGRLSTADEARQALRGWVPPQG